MKRLICMLYILLFVLLICACSETQTLQNTYSFYYCATDPGYGVKTGVVAVEERETACKEGDYPLLIEEYLRWKCSDHTQPAYGLSIYIKSNCLLRLPIQDIVYVSGYQLCTNKHPGVFNQRRRVFNFYEKILF